MRGDGSRSPPPRRSNSRTHTLDCPDSGSWSPPATPVRRTATPPQQAPPTPNWLLEVARLNERIVQLGVAWLNERIAQAPPTPNWLLEVARLNERIAQLEVARLNERTARLEQLLQFVARLASALQARQLADVVPATPPRVVPESPPRR